MIQIHDSVLLLERQSNKNGRQSRQCQTQQVYFGPVTSDLLVRLYKINYVQSPLDSRSRCVPGSEGTLAKPHQKAIYTATRRGDL
jgi:hypothetical protein